MVTENHIEVKKSGRYFTLGKPSIELDQIWFVFHGYGQLAKEFIEEFTPVLDNKKLFIAPEALNKFYFRGFSGKIGASWMTKEDRNNEINDYINYLNLVSGQVIALTKNDNIKFNILGFSQGCHTAIRWLNYSELKFNKIILWSGSFPTDIDLAVNADNIKDTKIISVQGKLDKLIDFEKIKKQITNLTNKGLDVNIIEHNGKHKLYPELLTQLI